MSSCPDFIFEHSLLPPNCRYLLGIDEVGRGPWAGPLTIGAFLLDLQNFSVDEFQNLKVRDSKKLSHPQRQKIVDYFKSRKFQFTTFSASNCEIDERGISSCLQGLFSKALKFYSSSFDFALIDGLPPRQSDFCSNNFQDRRPRRNESEDRQNLLQRKNRFVVHGDSLCYSIAAASIVAKVERDLLMDQYDLEFPAYGFASHKGYGTAFHKSALQTHGPCSIHRLSYKPLKNVIFNI